MLNNSETAERRDIVAMEYQQKFTCVLLNGVISNDLE